MHAAIVFVRDWRVQVFYRGFHMHHTGQRMVTRQFRPAAGGGAVLVRTDSVEFWDFDMQARASQSRCLAVLGGVGGCQHCHCCCWQSIVAEAAKAAVGT